MHVPEEDLADAVRHGFTFQVVQKPGRNQRWETVQSGIALPAEAVEHARQVSAWEVAVFTSEGYPYLSRRHPAGRSGPDSNQARLCPLLAASSHRQ